MAPAECAAGAGFQVTLKTNRVLLIRERVMANHVPGSNFRRVWRLACVVVIHTRTQIGVPADVMFGAHMKRFEEINVVDRAWTKYRGWGDSDG